jgi:hypothetical protein
MTEPLKIGILGSIQPRIRRRRKRYDRNLAGLDIDRLPEADPEREGQRLKAP